MYCKERGSHPNVSRVNLSPSHPASTAPHQLATALYAKSPTLWHPPSTRLATHYLISWLTAVHQISKKNGVLGAGQPASRHFAWALLDADTLVVLIDGLQGTESWS